MSYQEAYWASLTREIILSFTVGGIMSTIVFGLLGSATHQMIPIPYCIGFTLIVGVSQVSKGMGASRDRYPTFVSVSPDGIEIECKNTLSPQNLKVRWDAITEVQCKREFPYCFPLYTVKLFCKRNGVDGNPLRYRLILGNKIETTIPWPLERSKEFKAEIALHAPEGNGLRAFVLKEK